MTFSASLLPIIQIAAYRDRTKHTRKGDQNFLNGLRQNPRSKDQPINIGEGETEPGIRVDLGSKRSFSVVWTDSSRSKAKQIRYLGSDWRTMIVQLAPNRE